MIQLFKKPQKGEEGFTLVELLVVIVILGILAAIVVFAVGGINNSSQNSAQKAEVSTVQAAEEAYFAQNNVYVNGAKLISAGLLRTSEGSTTICLKGTGSPSALTQVGTSPNQYYTASDYYVANEATIGTQLANGTVCPNDPNSSKTGYLAAAQ
jgi:general secretion pathway protein G